MSAKPPATIDFVLGIVALVHLVLLVVTLICLRRAPDGYEDESGFHFGAPLENDVAARVVEVSLSRPIEDFPDRDFFGSIPISIMKTNEPLHG